MILRYRDSEQAAGVIFSVEEVVIASLLDAISIQEIEVGMPIISGEEVTITESALEPIKVRWMSYVLNIVNF